MQIVDQISLEVIKACEWVWYGMVWYGMVWYRIQWTMRNQHSAYISYCKIRYYEDLWPEVAAHVSKKTLYPPCLSPFFRLIRGNFSISP